jgi:hypothetical protein
MENFNFKKYLAESKLLKENLENDDIIYNNLLDMDHEQLVSDMLSKAEMNSDLTLIDYLKIYDYSDEE